MYGTNSNAWMSSEDKSNESIALQSIRLKNRKDFVPTAHIFYGRLFSSAELISL